MPSRWLLWTGATGALIGISWKFGPPKPRDLRVDIGMDASGEERVVGEVDAGHHVRSAERNLLRLGEEVVGVAVQHHAADRRDGNQFLRDELGRIEEVEAESLSPARPVKIWKPSSHSG